MPIDAQTRLEVRRRARFACEFCSVSEVDCGGQLTIDHYQPKAKGGDDEITNLIYSCNRCNSYKYDYWPEIDEDLPIWNPRNDPASIHFNEQDDGSLQPLSPIGAFTIIRLRLNRQRLIEFRRETKAKRENEALLAQYQNLIEVQERIWDQMMEVVDEQQKLLNEQSLVLKILMEDRR